MPKTLPLFVTVILLASCSRYQYGTIESSAMAKNDKMEFVTENDSMRLIYNFNGLNAPINLTIQNKLNVPISVDWQRSALIVNDKAISYVPGETPIVGGFSGSGYNAGTSRTSSYSYTSGSIHATAKVPEQLAFIPPQAYVTKNPMGVTNKFLENVPDTAYHKVNYYVLEGLIVPVKQAVFTETSSPLRFRSYLTIKIGDEAAQPVVYEHSFYVSELIKTSREPESMLLGATGRGNQYYIKEITGFGKTAAGFGVIAGTALITGTAEALSERAAGNGVRK